jgi:hypothetical protein
MNGFDDRRKQKARLRTSGLHLVFSLAPSRTAALTSTYTFKRTPYLNYFFSTA